MASTLLLLHALTGSAVLGAITHQVIVPAKRFRIEEGEYE
jgi:hypothetical protein